MKVSCFKVVQTLGKMNNVQRKSVVYSPTTMAFDSTTRLSHGKTPLAKLVS